MILLKRGEFKLHNIGFSKEQRENILQDKIDEVLRNKIDVGIHYLDLLNLLNLLLETTFKYLADQGVESEQTFV